MHELKRITVATLRRDEEQPRKVFDEAELLALGQNMLTYGQHVPIIAYRDENGLILLDGERRWRAAQLVGIADLNAVILSERPKAAALHLIQLSLEAHKVGLSPMERAAFLQKIKEENQWSVSEVAERLHMKQPLVSKLLSFLKLCSEAQAMLHAGELDMEKAYLISQASDAAKQIELLKQAPDLTRDQLRRKAHSNGEPVELKTSSVTFPLPTGMTVIVRGRQMTLSDAIEVLQDVTKELRHAQRNTLDITTAQRVFADKARRKT